MKKGILLAAGVLAFIAMASRADAALETWASQVDFEADTGLSITDNLDSYSPGDTSFADFDVTGATLQSFSGTGGSPALEWWGPGAVTFNFSSPIDTFGLNMIDWGTTTAGSITFNDTINGTTIAMTDGNWNFNNVLFFGARETGATFNQVVIETDTIGDFIAFDDIYYGTTSAPVPEPVSLALWGGLSAVGMAFGLRRRG